MNRAIFITGTDTNVGKTIVTFVLGTLLQNQGFKVGAMKPVQCGGDDAFFLRRSLNIKDHLEEINPYFASEPLSPHIAFKRDNIQINVNKIIDQYHQLKQKYDFLLIEGAGGLLVPIKENYLVIDLIKDLKADVVIVTRPGLGTINHTLLTINQVRERGLNIEGIIFNESQRGRNGIPEKTNPDAIRQFGNVPILGAVPFLKGFKREEILKKCQNKIDLKPLLKKKSTNRIVRLIKEDKDFIWHPFTQMKDWLNEEPLVIDRAKGHYLIDIKGNRYLDGISSLWVNVHGHGHPVIDEALKKQIHQLSHSTLLGLANTPSIELAKRLIEIAPKGLEKVFYSDNGSTAVEVALKMAYQYWQNVGQKNKTQIVHLANSYHGDTLGGVSVGGIDLFHKVYRDLIFKTISFDHLENLEKLEALFKKSHSTIAAFIVEPLIQAAAGMLLWPKGALRKIRQLCTQYNIFLIADEVATGFGRTGKMFACEHEKVTPDFMCLAKGLTGGYLPLAATLTTKKIFDGFLFDYKDQKTFFHGHTYTGNPLACAAALANLEVFQKEQTLKHLQGKIKYLSKRLKMFYNLPHVGDVRQQGFMVGIELVKDKKAKTPFDWQEKMGIQVCQQVRKKGVILRPLGNVIVLMPPLSITIKELENLLETLYWGIRNTLK